MDKKMQATPHKVEEQDRTVLSDGHFRLERMTLQTETFAGEMSRPLVREVLRSGRSVGVLLYDADADRFVLTEQFRIGAYLNELESPWLLECAAGMVDEGETPVEAARREVEEETGLPVRQIEQVGAYLTSPGITDELITIFVAWVDASRAGGVHGEEDEGEDIRTRLMTRDEALRAADEGAAINIVTQLALLWFARHGEALRSRWLAMQ